MMKSLTALMMTTVIVVTVLPLPAHALEDSTVWREFAERLKGESLTVERIRPYEGLSAETILGWLKTLGTEVTVEQLSAAPEMHRVGDLLHCVLVLPEASFCLTFLIDDDTWYFRHIESIFIRLDRIDSLPTSEFPDIAEEQKAWIREEIYWSQQVHFYRLTSAEKGKRAAFDMYRDGMGYFLSAKAWVPFVEPRRAFVLYACWEQVKLRGNSLTLERLADDSATIHFNKLLFFELYEHSSHLREQIPFEDYKQLFLTIWQDRATNAGWNLACEFEPSGGCVFRLTAGR